MSAQKVSFTVRRPTPVSRASSGAESDSSFKVPALPHHKRAGLNDSLPGSPLSHSLAASPHPEPDSDSSDDDAEGRDELVDAFDRLNGAQRTIPSRKRGPAGSLVIPALKNKDWRELARKRRTAGQYIPPSAAAQTGADGSVGGLGTRDSINSGPVLQGLQIRGKQTNDQEMKEEEGVKMEVVEEDLTEDELALRAILSGNAQSGDGPLIDIIPTPATEDDAYKQDVDELPEPATLTDYDRIPVSQFGAAMLRGMGWKEGQAASRKPGKGIVEPYLPSARPALLGIGAKEQEVYDDGSKKNLKPKRQDRKYVPLVKVAREGSEKRERIGRVDETTTVTATDGIAKTQTQVDVVATAIAKETETDAENDLENGNPVANREIIESMFESSYSVRNYNQMCYSHSTIRRVKYCKSQYGPRLSYHQVSSSPLLISSVPLRTRINKSIGVSGRVFGQSDSEMS